MRNISLAILFFFSSIALYAGGEEIDRLEKDAVRDMTEDMRKDRVLELENRLIQLQDIDFKEMERAERKEMKSELRYIKKELKAHENHGIYISTAGLVIIILLAIIIF
jgi:hypothetical protein